MKYEATPVEKMIIAASREIADGQVVMLGTQWPVVVGLFAKKTHAPDVTFVFEGGNICDRVPPVIPKYTADPVMLSDSPFCGGVLDTLGAVIHGGRDDVAFITGGNVDKYGNVNTTTFGDYRKGGYRLGGSGGACDFACLSTNLVIILEHDKKRFPEKVDFITSPGYLDGYDSRLKKGLRPGTGPKAVYTTLGCFRFDPHSKEMILDGYYHGVTVDEVKENMGWELKVPDHVRKIPSPTQEQIRILREEVDPEKMYLENARTRITTR